MSEVLSDKNIENFVKDKIFSLTENKMIYIDSDHKTFLKKRLYVNIMDIVNKNKEELDRVLNIVDEINEDSVFNWLHNENNNFDFVLKLNKKLYFDLRKIGSIAYDCFTSCPIKGDNENIKPWEYTIDLNEDAILLLERLFGKEKLTNILNCSSAEGLDFGQLMMERIRYLFLLSDKKVKKINYKFSPIYIVKEIIDKLGDERLKDNLEVLVEYLMDAQVCFLKNKYYNLSDQNQEAVTFTKDKIFSSKNIMDRFIRRDNNSQKIKEMVKALHENKIIDANLDDYRFAVKGFLQWYGIQDEDIWDNIEEKLSKNNPPFDWYIDGLTALISDSDFNRRCTIPKKIDKYKGDFFSENKKFFLKGLFDFGKEKILESNVSKDEYIVLGLINKSLPRHLSQLDLITNILKILIDIKNESKENIYLEMKKNWNNIYNWPFEIQNNFYGISNMLLKYDEQSYYILIKGLNELSKKNRKHFVQFVLQKFEKIISLVQLMNITEKKENLGKGSKVKGDVLEVRNIIQNTIDKFKKNNDIQEVVEELDNYDFKNLKNFLLKEKMFIKNPEKYNNESNKNTETFLTYWNNLSTKNEYNFGTIGLMIILHQNDLWDERRVDKTINIPDFSDEGKETMKKTLNNEEKSYRREYLKLETLKDLQKETSFQSHIHPQTYAEKIFNIQESFEELLDPDIYEYEEIKNVAKKLYRKKTKINILQNLHIELLSDKLPILNFLQQIEALKLSSLHKKLTKFQSNLDLEKQDSLKEEFDMAIKNSVLIFKEIVEAYKNKSMPDSAQIRIENVANNFSLEVDELSRQTNCLQEENKDILISSRTTNNMMDIIPNIRGCLGCTQKHNSNDVNLQFANPNRFLIMTDKQEEESRKNISDQICILLPSEKGLCFVLDRVYGIHNPKIMINNCLCMIKKIYQTDKNIKLFIPNNSIKSVGITSNNFLTIFKKEIEEYACKYGFDFEISSGNLAPDKKYAGYNEFRYSEDYIDGILISIK